VGGLFPFILDTHHHLLMFLGDILKTFLYACYWWSCDAVVQ